MTEATKSSRKQERSKDSKDERFKLEDLKDLSIEEIKNLELEDFLVYIQEFDNKKTQILIINLFKRVKQLTNNRYENANVSQIRNDFYNTKDLRKRANIIHEFITQKIINIPCDDDLNEDLGRIDQKIDRLDFATLEEAKETLDPKTPRYKTFREDTFIPLQLEIVKVFNKVRGYFVEDRSKKKKRDEYQRKLERLYETAFKAKAEGLNVEDGVGTHLEQGFEKAAQGAGLKTKQLANANKKKIEKARKEINDAKNKKAIMDALKEGGKITPEMQKYLEKIRKQKKK
jgi:hypothetical protein